MARNRNQRNRPPRGNRHARKPAQRDGAVWIYGTHAVLAALANPARRCERILAADPEVIEAAQEMAGARETPPGIEKVSRDDLAALLPPGAVHQNIALLAEPLEDPGLPAAIDDALACERPMIVVLDQVTDPQNVGAIMRSAAAFGATAVIVQDRHAPPVTGALAKAASGGLETVALVRETNLARTIGELKSHGFWCIGLAGEAETPLADARARGPVALVLGAEGAGLRRLVREACDALARIPQTAGVESLNVSNAAAVALYELTQPHETPI
jgi:23S rRNA (guanosine2251-2'-O)-methyltransferase